MKLFHRHSWVTISAGNYDQIYTPYNIPSLSRTIGDVTVLLQKCTICGDVRTKQIEGTWTMEQLEGTK